MKKYFLTNKLLIISTLILIMTIIMMTVGYYCFRIDPNFFSAIATLISAFVGIYIAGKANDTSEKSLEIAAEMKSMELYNENPALIIKEIDLIFSGSTPKIDIINSGNSVAYDIKIKSEFIKNKYEDNMAFKNRLIYPYNNLPPQNTSFVVTLNLEQIKPLEEVTTHELHFKSLNRQHSFKNVFTVSKNKHPDNSYYVIKQEIEVVK